VQKHAVVFYSNKILCKIKVLHSKVASQLIKGRGNSATTCRQKPRPCAACQESGGRIELKDACKEVCPAKLLCSGRTR
jgi:hypothetical protein